MLRSNSILLGQYRPLDSFLHSLDARAKLLPVLLVLVLGLLTESLLFYVVILGALLAGLIASGVGLSALMQNFRPVLIIVAVTFAYHLVFSGRDTAVQFTLLGFDVTSGALMTASFFSLRLVLFLSMAFLVTLTSSPSELAEAVTRLLRPLKRVRVPVDDLGLILFMALRFIPILYGEFMAIKHAQIIRGVSFSGSLVNRIRRTSSLLVPVLVTAIARADDLALAIEARGYRSGQPRTFYSRALVGRKEWAFIATSCLATSLLYWIMR
ncbi:MAG TPA: energy-coupling factor transporter transmembrane component T [Acidobacteriota bacterium]|nr:energy-coupling factor transporter transmembrane component T [Acidobacteriota bacterium]